jgi:histidine triad (HIT) family protein
VHSDADNGTDMNDCLFCKILAGDIPADIIYENEHVLAFRDINPKAPVHVLIIPRRHIARINDVTSDSAVEVGQLVAAAAEIARAEGVADDGYRVVMNCNAHAGQTVFHLHLHLLGGRILGWPPG